MLRVLLGLSWLAAALVFAVGLRALNADRAALRTLRFETAPTIIAAQELGAQLADLDTQLASSMLGGSLDRDVAGELFELRRSAVTRRLVDAASAMTAGDAERIPVVVMNEELGRYLELASRAQALYAAGDRDGALALLRVATDVMHDRILPRAGDLDHVKRDQMDQRYEAAQAASRGYAREAVASGALLGLVLLGAQVFLRRRARRRVNPWLLLATALTVGFAVTLVGRFGAAREDLRVARDDAFNSIHLLWRARALAHDAKGDEARWLLDRPRAGLYESGFSLKLAQLVTDPRARTLPRDAGGLLADELRNITFQGERDGAQAALDAVADFVRVDDNVRKLVAQGRPADAVELAIGLRPDGARAAFDRFDESLQRTAAINQDAFDAVLTLADRGLRRAEWVDPILSLIIALLAWLGIRPRLREYA